MNYLYQSPTHFVWVLSQLRKVVKMENRRMGAFLDAISRQLKALDDRLVQLEKVEIVSSVDVKLYFGLSHYDTRYFLVYCCFDSDHLEVSIGDHEIKEFSLDDDLDGIAKEIAQESDDYYQISYNPDDWEIER
jgi:hypothetical protein